MLAISVLFRGRRKKKYSISQTGSTQRTNKMFIYIEESKTYLYFPRPRTDFRRIREHDWFQCYIHTHTQTYILAVIRTYYSFQTIQCAHFFFVRFFYKKTNITSRGSHHIITQNDELNERILFSIAYSIIMLLVMLSLHLRMFWPCTFNFLCFFELIVRIINENGPDSLSSSSCINRVLYRVQFCVGQLLLISKIGKWKIWTAFDCVWKNSFLYLVDILFLVGKRVLCWCSLCMVNMYVYNLYVCPNSNKPMAIGS